MGNLHVSERIKILSLDVVVINTRVGCVAVGVFYQYSINGIYQEILSWWNVKEFVWYDLIIHTICVWLLQSLFRYLLNYVSNINNIRFKQFTSSFLIVKIVFVHSFRHLRLFFYFGTTLGISILRRKYETGVCEKNIIVICFSFLFL